MNKEIIQEEALQALLTNKGNIALVAATGSGKSKIVIDFIKTKYKTFPDMSILIVVPTEKLRDENWKEEFEKWEAINIWNNNVSRLCYASLSKISNKHFDLIILDELQNITDNNSVFFERNTYKKIIALTATMPTEFDKKIIISELNIRVVYEIPIDVAVKNKLVAPFKITIIETTLDTDNRNVKFKDRKIPYFLTEYEAYQRLSKDIEDAIIFNNNKLKFLSLARMRLIYNALNKTKVAKFILNNLIKSTEKTLIFSGSIEQANKLCKHTFHSKTNDKDFEAFKKDEILQLSCVNALNEGMNIPLVDTAIITQVNSKERHLIQRINKPVLLKSL